jgi:hypothetical protein
MILLTVIAVGLLTLSSVSLRASSQGEAMQAARANARLALAMAIAQLQKETGPDQRITMLADQRPSGANALESAAAPERRQWTGVYSSWLVTSANRPTPEFRTWLVSGTDEVTRAVAAADNAGAANSSNLAADTIELVGKGTLGSTNTSGRVAVPALRIQQPNGKSARTGWWIGDQGMKAAVATPPASRGTSLAAVRSGLQAASRNALEFVSLGANKPFSDLDPEDARLPDVTSWQQSAFLATDVTAPRGLFHDLVAYSTGMLTNVRSGGFRKDLSMRLEQLANLASNRRPADPLYTVGNENGINLAELAVWYKAYDPATLRNSGSYTFTTGGRLDRGTPHLVIAANATEATRDERFHLKQPTIISYQMVLSFKVFPVVVNGQTLQRLHLVSDPVITLWNPLDVPVVMPSGQFMSIKYWQIPYDFVIRVNGGPQIRAPLGRSLSSHGDSNYLTLQIGRDEQIVMKPGEIIKFSQVGSTLMMSQAGNRHQLSGRKGFNHGGGFAFPLLRTDGTPIDLTARDTITYEAFPNNLTGGKTGSSGNVPPGGSNHSRHFSITHHEVYVGPDRGQLGSQSLGYGGMFIDWDFGNRRLRPGEVRQTNQAGTKPSSARLYADRPPANAVFEPVTGAKVRPLSFGNLAANKAPFLLVSYDAKTEAGSATATRSLARMNPRAHHIDFYDLTQTERDMLPYEFRAEPLDSWVNRSLDVSPDGSGFFGGGMTARDGTNIVVTHSFPRGPVVSLGALQHSFANGFEIHAPIDGYAILNGREPMMPHISHAIGNSLAPAVLPPNRSEGSLPGGRPLADHSYLANRALWDDWFFSGITPLITAVHGETKTQKAFADEFFAGSRKVPVVRYLPTPGDQNPTQLVNSFFSGINPTDLATNNLARYLRVDGMFNVNSTSVEAWKAVLGGLKGRPVVVTDATGKESLRAIDDEITPVAGLMGPRDLVAKGDGNVDLRSVDQWTGRRELSETEIDELARAIVAEVRKRGPFLSLGDFVNRRVGDDKDLARAGAIQNALDSQQSKINEAYNSATRSVGSAASRFANPEAEKGPISYGIPGIVKQADILTPIAPILSARSDSFIIRAYGETVDGTGRVIARAWCEAVVERSHDFINPQDKPETVLTSLTSEENKRFGRRYELVLFRWLSPSEV